MQFFFSYVFNILYRLVGVGEASFISLAAPFIDDNAPVAQVCIFPLEASNAFIFEEYLLCHSVMLNIKLSLVFCY